MSQHEVERERLRAIRARIVSEYDPVQPGVAAAVGKVNELINVLDQLAGYRRSELEDCREVFDYWQIAREQAEFGPPPVNNGWEGDRPIWR